MNAPAIAAPTRPNLEIESEARRGCRNGLGGLACVHFGIRRQVRSSGWNADSRLIVYLDSDPEPTLAADVTLISTWPDRCCRSRLTHDGLPKPKRRKGAR